MLGTLFGQSCSNCAPITPARVVALALGLIVAGVFAFLYYRLRRTVLDAVKRIDQYHARESEFIVVTTTPRTDDMLGQWAGGGHEDVPGVASPSDPDWYIWDDLAGQGPAEEQPAV